MARDRSSPSPSRTPPQRSTDAAPREVALAGRSNVGKSSLINAVVGRVVAPVAKRAGKTRRVERYPVTDRGTLVDLPGYGFAAADTESRAAWRHEIEEYLFHAPQLRGVVFVLDARHAPGEIDREMLTLLEATGWPFLIVANKVDALSGNQRAVVARHLRETLDLPGDAPVLLTSARRGTGIRELRQSFRELWKANAVPRTAAA